MPEPDAIPVSASIASTGLGIRYIGNHAYAYSGIVGINDSDTTLVEFTSGSGFITAKLQVQNGSGSGDDMRYDVTLNGTIVARWTYSATPNVDPLPPLYLVIPPFTIVKVSGLNQTGASSRNHTATFTGRVYGAE